MKTTNRPFRCERPPQLQRIELGGPVPPHQIAPDDFCHRCLETTPGVYLPLGGRVGNCCRKCHATRKGQPFVHRHVLDIDNATANARARAEEYRHACPNR